MTRHSPYGNRYAEYLKMMRGSDSYDKRPPEYKPTEKFETSSHYSREPKHERVEIMNAMYPIPEVFLEKERKEPETKTETSEGKLEKLNEHVNELVEQRLQEIKERRREKLEIG